MFRCTSFGLFGKGEMEQANDILTSIAALGLCSPKSMSLRGALKFSSPTTQLCYNQVDLTDSRRLDETVNSLVFDGKEGFWAISCERSFASIADARLPYELSDALLNSVAFVFACELKKRGERPDVIVHRWPNLRLCGTPTAGEDEHYLEEVRLPGEEYPILPHEIKAILVPNHLLALVKRAFPATLIIPVASHEQTLTEDPIELFVTGKTIRGNDVLGPNYARALHVALAEHPDLKTFGVHLTRLPYVYRTNPELTLSINRESYNKMADRTTLRLINPSAKQLADIAALAGVQILKEDRRKAKNYLCFCSSAQKEEMAEIMASQDTVACGVR